jgi:cobalt-zinc-cadmium efflux system membrane fusion protein
MTPTTMTRIKTALPLLIAFLLGGVSVRLWLDTAPPEKAHAERTGHERNGHQKQEPGGHGEKREEGKLSLSPEARREAGITIAEAAGGRLEQTLDLPGELTLNADTVVHIVPRAAGIVQRVHKNLGDDVKPGGSQATTVPGAGDTRQRRRVESQAHPAGTRVSGH